MKLTVPAIRVAEPDPARQEAFEHTVLLLEAIDALLAEATALTMTVPAPASQASQAICARPGHHGGRGPRRPISPSA
jgi:hypothetical protein